MECLRDAVDAHVCDTHAAGFGLVKNGIAVKAESLIEGVEKVSTLFSAVRNSVRQRLGVPAAEQLFQSQPEGFLLVI